MRQSGNLIFLNQIIISSHNQLLDFKWFLDDGDIIIEAYYYKHTNLPVTVLLKHLITYPEFMNETVDELENYASCDIANGHWSGVRVNMPSNATDNLKQAKTDAKSAELEAE